ncbi:MAG TPA: protein kinase [Kofleriaceae bacterium]|nr:protein kinase [Kofleriaceae bacterium]
MTRDDRPGAMRRLFGWLRGEPARPERLSIALPEGVTAVDDEPASLQPEEEAWLRGLVGAVANGKRTQEVGGEEFWTRIEELWARGHERLATEWIEKFILAPGTPPAVLPRLRSELVDMLDRRGEGERALPHLHLLTELEPHALRAHYLLAELHRRRGDELLALRHYEAVLARDMEYPNVRVRVDRLRASRGLGAPAPMGETIIGAGTVGVAGGARYQLLRELGRGATGVVYMARDFELDREVAIKLLHPHLAAADRAAACARFFEEARIAASLRHPNIIAILDLDERARRIVMELASGGTLRGALLDQSRRSVRRALERHAQILSALNAAHRRGVVHRDLKPGNLMFRRDPEAPGVEVVLGDFGVAHLPNEAGATGAAAATQEQPGEAIGTLAYMAPEQRAGQPVDPRADLYSAAVVLYEMLVGRTPWKRDVLLSGTRRAGDFHLPPDVTREIQPELAIRVQAHLDSLGDPDPAGRPATEPAVKEARRLRDLAIAEAS